MSSIPSFPPVADAPSRHRRRAVLTLTALGLLACAVPFVQSVAGAAPNPCQTPFAPGGICPDPPPDDPPPPPPARFTVIGRTLVQDPAGIVPGAVVERGWLTAAGVQPAGSSPLLHAAPSTQLDFPDAALPAGARMVLRVSEPGNPGSLCRTTPLSSVPPNFRNLHLLVPKPITQSSEDLDAAVASFLGVQTGLPPDVHLTLTSTSLDAVPEGLELRLHGTLSYPPLNINVTLDYRVVLELEPVTSADTTKVATVTPVAPGTVSLAWIGTPPPDGDNLLVMAVAALTPELNARVGARAEPAMNEAITRRHEVAWWTNQGFTLSMRKISTSAAGLTLHPALCRF